MLVKSKVPEALIKKSYASSSAVAWTIYQKYVNSVPLYGQEKDWKQYGAALSRSTLAGWIIQCSQTCFFPVIDYCTKAVLRDYAMGDEPRMQC
ncbi:MAG: transposase [bacterium LCO1.1]|uniref:Transposase n=1 Tax=Candidatus Weimeria bifida TaxID=2599074 RepID=A0A6N7IYV7_9FIRM|nr:transposase [Candidatus Weimeria bifida]